MITIILLVLNVAVWFYVGYVVGRSKIKHEYYEQGRAAGWRECENHYRLMNIKYGEELK